MSHMQVLFTIVILVRYSDGNVMVKRSDVYQYTTILYIPIAPSNYLLQKHSAE